MKEFPIEIPWNKALAQKVRLLFLLCSAAPILLWAMTGMPEIGVIPEILVLTFFGTILISYEPFTPYSSLGRRRIWLGEDANCTGTSRKSCSIWHWKRHRAELTGKTKPPVWPDKAGQTGGFALCNIARPLTPRLLFLSAHSTVTLLARLRGLSTSQPRRTLM